MEIISDLQIHSRFSRATSKAITFDNLEKYARIKGIDLLGCADFQHPRWNKEIKENLKEDENGILWSKNKFPFLWQTEISLMYKDIKQRAVHLLVFSPNKEISDQIIDVLGKKGRLDYDGRPIFGIPSVEFVEMMKEIDDKIEVIPAHCLLPNEKIICNPEIKEVSKINIGDKVLTHTGSYKKVTNTFIRKYEGQAYRIQPYYFRDSINITSEHPFLAIKTTKNCSAVGGLCKPNNTGKGKHICRKKHYERYRAKWVIAEDLEVNDVLLYPRTTETKDIEEIFISNFIINKNYRIKGDYILTKSGRQDKKINNKIIISSDFCRLIGYFLAEGYIIKKNNCLQFSFAKHEKDYINDVIILMKKCFNLDLTKIRENSGYELYFYSKVIVDLFDSLFYEENKVRRAFSKRIPQWMLCLPLEKQVEIFRGWWRGDTGVTVSEILSQQMKILCLRLGIIPSVYSLDVESQNKYNRFIKNRRIVTKNRTFYLQNLSFFEDKFNLLEDDSFKKFKTKLQRKHGWIDENYAYLPIKKIEKFQYEGNVYNLEVDEDNSYVTSAATVHNCMTSWFGVFGSKSGFDSLKECFKDKVNKIYAIESGMSADPQMLWRLKEKVNIVSFSDAHSFWPYRIGREATIFDLKGLSYGNIMKAIRTGEGLKGTIEVFPQYGKYHIDGHRNCGFSCDYIESKRLNKICPKCKRELTIGVEYRIEELAKEKKGFKPGNANEVIEVIPLQELIAVVCDTKLLNSKRVLEIYDKLIKEFGNEFNVLLNVSYNDLIKFVHEKLANLIIKNRNGELKIKAGFDGVYGQIILDNNEKIIKQRSLSEFK